jgi:hypothetical protein
VQDDKARDEKKVEHLSQRLGISERPKRERSNHTTTCSSPSLIPATPVSDQRSRSTRRGKSRDVVHGTDTVSPINQDQVTQPRLTNDTSSANATERRNTTGTVSDIESDSEVAHADSPADSDSESLSYSKPRKNPKRYAIYSLSHLVNRCRHTGSDFDDLQPLTAVLSASLQLNE